MSLAAFVIAYVLARFGLYIPSGTVIILTALFLTYRRYMRTKRLIDPLTIVSFFWLGAVGISAMKLSYLQTEWTLTSWISFYLFYILFAAGFELTPRITARVFPHRVPSLPIENRDVYAGGILIFANILIIVSTIALIAETALLGFLPLFTEDTPHAYSYFHVSGLHYLTVSFVLVPAIIVIMLSRFRSFRDLTFKYQTDIVIMLLISLIYPLLMVSRFQLIFELTLAVAAYFICIACRTLSLKKGALMLAGMGIAIILYIFITYERAHSAEYLMGIFEMKYELPLWIAQPYIYIANNFDNFNAMTIGLSSHAHGLRELFPIFALTGLKFIFPGLTDFPLFVTKDELTTLTLIYDAYYDFGILGVVLFSFLLGALSSLIALNVQEGGRDKPALILLYTQILFYLVFSFFTTWFSNAASWFYFLLTLSLWIYLMFYAKIKRI